jgi:hypothetical protein
VLNYINNHPVQKMNAIEALKTFVEGALLLSKARRYVALLETKKGLRKIMEDLPHRLETELDPRWITQRTKMPMTSPCFVFKAPRDLGTPYDTMQEAYDLLSGDNSWLIIAQDGLAGIHRPEDRWDAEKMIRVE